MKSNTTEAELKVAAETSLSEESDAGYRSSRFFILVCTIKFQEIKYYLYALSQYLNKISLCYFFSLLFHHS